MHAYYIHTCRKNGRGKRVMRSSKSEIKVLQQYMSTSSIAEKRQLVTATVTVAIIRTVSALIVLKGTSSTIQS